MNYNEIAKEIKGVNRICIIDDDKIYRFTTERYIQMLGLATEVIAFSDGEEALAYFKANYHQPPELPDIIFLDLNMPIMDGWDFIKEYDLLIPKMKKKILVFMVSSSIDERDRSRALEIGAVSDFIIKPITEQELIQVVRQAAI